MEQLAMFVDPSGETEAMSAERLTQLEGRVDGVETTVDDHGTRLTGLETKVTDVRIGMVQLHSDLRLNNQATEQIQKSVSAIQADTREMIAVYRATPRMQDNVRFWGWLFGTLWAAAMAGGTMYIAFIK